MFTVCIVLQNYNIYLFILAFTVISDGCRGIRHHFKNKVLENEVC